MAESLLAAAFHLNMIQNGEDLFSVMEENKRLEKHIKEQRQYIDQLMEKVRVKLHKQAKMMMNDEKDVYEVDFAKTLSVYMYMYDKYK